MPQFAAFPGIRFAVDPIARVTAPPYDVIDGDQRNALAAQHPHNVVRIDMPVDGYDEAAAVFNGWRKSGVLATDTPSLYPYRMTSPAGSTLGVFGALTMSDDVLPHEHTTPKAHSDRLSLLRATEANFSAIWGLSLTQGLTALIDLDAADLLGDWTDPDGIRHELWRSSDPATVKAVEEAVAANPVMIADGHHRYSTCQIHSGDHGAPAGAAATLALVVELDHEQLHVDPIHRLLPSVPDLSGSFVLGDLEPLPDDGVVDRLIADRTLALVTPDGMRTLRPTGQGDGVEPLDSETVAAACDGIDLTYQHGVANVVDAVTSGRAAAAILLRPVSVEQIRATAEARGLMPPKSTFFHPKPRTGTVFRSLLD